MPITDRIRSLRDWSAWIIALSTVGAPTLVASVITGLASLIPSAVPVPLLVGLFIGTFAVVLALTLVLLRRAFPARPSLKLADAPTTEAPPAVQVLDQTQTYFKGLHFRITDLAVREPILRDKVFEDCAIFGPAVLVLSEHVALGVTVMAERPSDMLFTLEPGRKVMGPIIVENCVFRRCRFVNIGLMADAEGIKQLLGDFNQILSSGTGTPA
ncbi:MAG: hypothetical protein HY263_01755 [Chloroflexi bacterium]|nr:hypothetical protein [Chloroflexota bacterium]